MIEDIKILKKRVSDLYKKVRNTSASEPSYKVYVGLLTLLISNHGEDYNLVATILENTLEEVPTLQRTADGEYKINSPSNLFDISKTVVFIGNSNSPVIITTTLDDINSAFIAFKTWRQGFEVDEFLVIGNNGLQRTPIEIRVYN